MVETEETVMTTMDRLLTEVAMAGIQEHPCREQMPEGKQLVQRLRPRLQKRKRLPQKRQQLRNLQKLREPIVFKRRLFPIPVGSILCLFLESYLGANFPGPLL